MNKIVGVIDEPVSRGGSDNLDINVHSNSLTKFIHQTSTPITIGIQGEWGSGKTSLINSIHFEFEKDQSCKQIWINSWEYSLLAKPEETLLKIISRIIDELLESDQNVSRSEAIKGGAEKIFKGALRIGAQVALGSEAANVASELIGSSEHSISKLREQLTSLVNDISERPTNPYKKIIIYVDDLDRIEPKNAVAILELLKNIFSIPNCVFILAIDYQVVVKGLEHKFGKQTAENEWEFRAFFDKIIQLPFMMPMGQYNIGKYVNSLLIQIGFVEGEGLDDQSVREIILRTIGGNPRSIKRLVNSLSLIQIFTEEKKLRQDSTEVTEGVDDEINLNPEDEKFLMFALLCLQIAYPYIYSFLNLNPDFPKWDDSLAFSETNRKEEESEEVFKREFEIAQETEDFDEEWEKVLFRICYPRQRLKPRVIDISKFFSYLKDELLKENEDNIGDILASILSQTSVTSVTSTDQGQQAELPVREKGSYKRVWLNDSESLIRSLESHGIGEEGIELTKYLLNDIQEFMPDDIEIKYLEDAFTVSVSKHKIFRAISRQDQVRIVTILKDFEMDYKVPKIDGIPTQTSRIYKGRDKPSTAGFSESFFMRIKSKQIYDNQKEHIQKILEKAYDIAKNHWDKRLLIDPRTGTIKSTLINIENDEAKTEEYAFKFLSEDYTYDVE